MIARCVRYAFNNENLVRNEYLIGCIDHIYEYIDGSYVVIRWYIIAIMVPVASIVAIYIYVHFCVALSHITIVYNFLFQFRK